MDGAFDVANLKVNDLRDELKRRSLNPIGTKAILTQRLQQALSAEGLTLQDFAKSLTERDAAPVAPTSPAKPAPESDAQVLPSGDANVEVKPEEVAPAVDINADSQEEPKSVGEQKEEPEPVAVKRSRSRSPRRSPSREHDKEKRSPRPSRPSVSIDDEADGWELKEDVFLDGYNCDLSLLVDKSGYSAKPMTTGGFSLMWAGVRANYGIRKGKVFFEVRLLKQIPVENLDSLSGGATHVLRVGWSTETTGFALGEEPLSFGYGGTGKKSCDNKFTDYGCKFGEGDTVGSFLELTDSEAVMSFAVNGVHQGECFRVSLSSLGSEPVLFPHIYVKNVEFSVNFGQSDMPAWFAPSFEDPASWKIMNETPIADRVHGRMPPASKSECEVTMMIGLPGCGKTYFAENLCKEHKEKQFNMLGTNLILDKMKVTGLNRKRNYAGRWDVLIEKATHCLNSLISLACKRRRNYILDQTNVYPSAQRRKMRPFEGFQRKAIVIVPTDEEFRRRIAQREKEEGKEVPENAVLEMKANFEIPKPSSEDPSSPFDDVIFTELPRKEAEDLVKKYNAEGRSNRPPPEKRQRMDHSRDHGRESRFSDRDKSDRSRPDSYSRSPPYRDNRDRRDMRGGYDNYRDRSDDRNRFSRGPPGRDRGDSYGRGGRFGSGGPDARFGRGPYGGDRPMGPPPYGAYPSGPGPRGRGGPGPRGAYGPPPGGMDFRGGRGAGMNPMNGPGGFRGGPPPGRLDTAPKPENFGGFEQPQSGYGASADKYSTESSGRQPSPKPYPFSRGGTAGRGMPARGGSTTTTPSTASGGFNRVEDTEAKWATGPTRGGMDRGRGIPSGRPNYRGGGPPGSSYTDSYGSYGRPDTYNTGYAAYGDGESTNYGQSPSGGPPTASGRQSGSRFSTAPPKGGQESYSSYETYGTKPEDDQDTGFRSNLGSRGSRGSFSQQSGRPGPKPQTDSTFRGANPPAPGDAPSYAYGDYYASDPYGETQQQSGNRSYNAQSGASGKPGPPPAAGTQQHRQQTGSFAVGAAGPPRGGRPSRFSSQTDDAVISGTNPTAPYPPTGGGSQGGYQYYGGMNASSGPSATGGARKDINNVSAPTRERTRFDQGPPSSATSAPAGSSRQDQPPAGQSQQSYNYGYGQQSQKSDYSGYGGSYGSYGNTNNTYGSYAGYTSGSQQPSSASGPVTTTAPSLYASAVGGSTRQSTVSDSSQANASSAYTSYYGSYGAAASSAGIGAPGTTAAAANSGQTAAAGSTAAAGYDASFYAAQQFNAWQYNQAPSTAGASAGAAPPASAAVGAGSSSAAVPSAANPQSYQAYNYPYSNYGYGGSGASGQSGSTQSASQYYSGYQ